MLYADLGPQLHVIQLHVDLAPNLPAIHADPSRRLPSCQIVHTSVSLSHVSDFPVCDVVPAGDYRFWVHVLEKPPAEETFISKVH